MKMRNALSHFCAAAGDRGIILRMSKQEIALFGAGCFWGIEEAFRTLPGVLSTVVGYTGGTTENPTYESVCSHMTGHAEAVQITFDPEIISYDELLEKFWSIHNPTQKNRQGPDLGTQYRSVIFTHSEEQKKKAEASKEQLEKSGIWKEEIATEIVPATPFYRAEEYHQQYILKTGDASCHL